MIQKRRKQRSRKKELGGLPCYELDLGDFTPDQAQTYRAAGVRTRSSFRKIAQMIKHTKLVELDGIQKGPIHDDRKFTILGRLVLTKRDTRPNSNVKEVIVFLTEDNGKPMITLVDYREERLWSRCPLLMAVYRDCIRVLIFNGTEDRCLCKAKIGRQLAKTLRVDAVKFNVHPHWRLLRGQSLMFRQGISETKVLDKKSRRALALRAISGFPEGMDLGDPTPSPGGVLFTANCLSVTVGAQC